MADLAKLVEELGTLTVLEAAQLAKMLEAAWGVSAAAPMAAGAMPMMAGAAPAAAAPAVVEKTEFDVVLKAVDPAKKINVIKAVRELTNNALGLREAKEAVETLPNAFKKGVSKEEAEQARAKLTEAGATVEVV
ncbi:MAG: 50S ribosomal protein L7/L12 [Chloroflexi bacterium]|nr:50S ribosomal protein L7/L12 [Chloroflexota bacterium]